MDLKAYRYARRRLRLAILPILLVAGWLGGCASVSVTSEPRDAEVVLVSASKDKPQPLGKTPYAASYSDLAPLAGDGPVVVRVEKDGFVPQSFVVPDVAGGQLTIKANLVPLSSGSFAEINKVVRMTLQAERHILQKQYDEALALAKEIRKVSESAVSAYEIEGSVYLLKGDLERSREAWRRSLEIEPDNPDAMGMVRLVEEKLGVKKG